MAGSGNAFQQSARGMQLAGQNTLANMNYQPMAVQSPGGYNPTMVNPNQPGLSIGGQDFSYNPQQVTSPGFNATQLAGMELSQYMNPFTTNVIDNVTGDLNRARQMELNQSGAAATNAGAFGGSRHGLVEAENNRNFYDRAGSAASQLRLQGFNNAQNMALQDANILNQAGQFNAAQGMQAQLANQSATARADEFGNQLAFQGAGRDQQALLQTLLANQSTDSQARALASQQNMQAQLANQSADLQGNQQRLGGAMQLSQLANMGFGMGNSLNTGLQQQGAMQQAMMQRLADAGRLQHFGFMGMPQQSLGMLGGALGSLPVPQSTTNSRDPGLFDYLTLGASII